MWKIFKKLLKKNVKQTRHLISDLSKILKKFKNIQNYLEFTYYTLVFAASLFKNKNYHYIE